MGSWGHCDFKDIKQLKKSLEDAKKDSDAFIQSCAKELAARLLTKVIKRTPVGEYNKPVSFTTVNGKQVNFTPHAGKNGGTLRRGWTAEKENINEKGNVIGVKGESGYANGLKVVKEGDSYTITVSNSVIYASYVEYGHRTANLKGWVPGQFMLTISERELQAAAPAILERKIELYLRRHLNVK